MSKTYTIELPDGFGLHNLTFMEFLRCCPLDVSYYLANEYEVHRTVKFSKGFEQGYDEGYQTGWDAH